ncbi:MAG: hypothetical protein Q7V63_01830 [Gammaproteobacteria bacterium]|nr:hypothetical protein [Gammaproteobacteria bacterium]
MQGIEFTNSQATDHTLSATTGSITAPLSLTLQKSTIYSALSGNLPLIIAFGSMAAGNIVKQMIVAEISENASELSAIRQLITRSIIPIETGVFNIMLSEVLKLKGKPAYNATKIGSIYQVNLLVSLGLVLLSYPIIANASSIVNSPALGLGISETDTASLNSCLRWDYATGMMNAIYLADLLLYFQNRNLSSAAISLFCGEILDVALCYLLAKHTNLGLSSIAVSDLSSTVLALIMSKYIQMGYMPAILQSTFPSMADFKLFTVSSQSRAQWIDSAKKLFRLGALPWSATLIENISNAISNIAFSSIGLQGALSVIQSTCNDITQVVLLSSSPHIAETEVATLRKSAISRQFTLGLLPNLFAFGIGMAIPRQLSSTMGGDSMVSLTDSELRANISLAMAGGIASNLMTIMYETFIDCGDTNWPSAIIMIGAAMAPGLCYALVNKVDSSTVGNYALLIAAIVTLINMSTYYGIKYSSYCARPSNKPALALYTRTNTEAAIPLLERAR